MPEMGTISLGTAAAMRRLLDGDETDSDDGHDTAEEVMAGDTEVEQSDDHHLDGAEPDPDSHKADDAPPTSLSEIQLVEPKTKRVVAAIGLFLIALILLIVLLLIL